MTQNMKRCCTCLVAVLASGFFGRAMSFADEVIRTDIPDDQMGSYVDELARTRKIVTELKIAVIGGKPAYKVTSIDNSRQKPWVIEFNISEAAFKTSSKKYEGDGFAMTIQRKV